MHIIEFILVTSQSHTHYLSISINTDTSYRCSELNPLCHSTTHQTPSLSPALFFLHFFCFFILLVLHLSLLPSQKTLSSSCSCSTTHFHLASFENSFPPSPFVTFFLDHSYWFIHKNSILDQSDPFPLLADWWIPITKINIHHSFFILT